MDLNWSLKEIYPSFESKEFKNDLLKLKEYIEDIKEFSIKINNKDDILNALEDYINLINNLNTIQYKLYSYVNLVTSVDTKDINGLKYTDILDNMVSDIKGPEASVKRWISNIDDIDSIIEKSILLKEHEFFIKEIVKESRYLLSENEEKIISNMKNTGSKAFSKLKDTLISSLMVDIEEDGVETKLPLTVVLNMAYSEDKEIRKKGYEAEIKSYEKVEDGVAAALNGIKGEVITECTIRGYKSPLDMTLLHSRMDKKTLDAMLDAMKESMPKFREYLKRKASILGYNNGLPFYEMYAPISNTSMQFTYEEAGNFIIKNFNTFSKHLGEFANRAIENNWIDVMPKKGKVGGAFCHGLHFIGESRILLNFGGQFGDVVTMAHELGHGFHDECLKNEVFLNSDYPMPIAETASTFCETIIKKSAIKDATKDEALYILENEISDSTQVIVDIYSRFLFESNLFAKRKESSLSVDEIKELMINAQKEAYGDGLDNEYLHPYMWAWKPHYYDADYNFYNFPYAFGLLFAKGLYAEYLKRKETFPSDYEKLLAYTGKANLKDIAMTMGIDITSKEFWKSSLDIVIEDINSFLELTK